MSMADSWFFDKNFNGVPDDFFDDAIKYFDFPLEDVEVNDEEEDWGAKFQNLEPPPSNILEGLSCGVYGENSNAILKVENESPVSRDRSSQPSTGETSSRSVPLYYDSLEGKYVHLFRTSSPVSVLDSSSSSSCSAENQAHNLARIFVPVKRPRSKRSRLQRRIFPFITSACAFKRFHPIAAFESESESYTDEKMLNSTKRRQKKRKNLMLLSCDEEVKKSFSQQPVETRKCTHCGVSKTPQWREGPMGPKTLCNACGVRFRSGRLLPEYRPAASPTFVSSLHSNSHRKVLEMRKKAIQPTYVGMTGATFPTAPEY